MRSRIVNGGATNPTNLIQDQFGNQNFVNGGANDPTISLPLEKKFATNCKLAKSFETDVRLSTH